MKWGQILVEGQTEERFVKDVLREHLRFFGLELNPIVLITKRTYDGGRFQGGLTGFGKFKNEVQRLLGGRSTLVTTMFDYYRLPADFPGMETRPKGSCLERVNHVEAALHQHFGLRRDFLPYLSLHEFEALLFSSLEELPRILIKPEKISEFADIRASFPTPEDINERPDQSPSKRIEALFPTYRKRVHGPIASKRIGLDRIRAECPHFNAWVKYLEAFAQIP